MQISCSGDRSMWVREEGEPQVVARNPRYPTTSRTRTGGDGRGDGQLIEGVGKQSTIASKNVRGCAANKIEIVQQITKAERLAYPPKYFTKIDFFGSPVCGIYRTNFSERREGQRRKGTSVLHSQLAFSGLRILRTS